MKKLIFWGYKTCAIKPQPFWFYLLVGPGIRADSTNLFDRLNHWTLIKSASNWFISQACWTVLITTNNWSYCMTHMCIFQHLQMYTYFVFYSLSLDLHVELRLHWHISTYQSDTPCCAIVYPYKGVSLFCIPDKNLEDSLSYLRRASYSCVDHCNQPNTPLIAKSVTRLSNFNRREKLIKQRKMLKLPIISLFSSSCFITRNNYFRIKRSDIKTWRFVFPSFFFYRNS